MTSALILPRSRNSGRKRPEGVAHHAAEERQDHQRDRGQLPVHVEQKAHGDDGGQQTSGELNQSGADEVPNPLRVRHDARDEHAGLGLVEIADGQPQHVLFDPPPHVGDGALGADPQHLREGEGRSTPERSSRRRWRGRAGSAGPICCLPMTSSMNDFVDQGSTKPASVLIATSTKPSASRHRRAQISSRASDQAADQRIFFFFFSGSAMATQESRAVRIRIYRWQDELDAGSRGPPIRAGHAPRDVGGSARRAAPRSSGSPIWR